MSRSFIFIAAIGLACGVGAFGQMPGPGMARGMGRVPFGPMMGPGHGKTVTNAPYSATLTNSVVEHLDGGNTIQRTTTGQIARDDQGRTFEQITVTRNPFGGTSTPHVLTFITDPVAGYSYVLDSATKTAVQRPLRQRSTSTDSAPANRPAKPNVVESELPADSSSGVPATGKLVTHTIPAGSIGNTQDIVSTTQTWYSADLQIVVKSVRNDPRWGQSTFALTNIVTKEPDPSLFKVPAGYTVTTAPSHVFARPAPAE